MTIQLVRKPPSGNHKTERLKVTLLGNHTVKQKACMFMQVKFWLHHEHGIDTAGVTDFYINFIDPNGDPLTTFRNDILIADYNLLIDSPYHCAADEHCA
jgi:hypothetical protein